VKVSGFTFVRDAVRLKFPVVPAIRSILPLVDEMVVNVGVCQDGTLDLIRSIGDPRLVIFESEWNPASQQGGRVLAEQTNLALERCSGQVGIYVQGDEAVHEDDHPALRAALERLHAEPRADGLLFDYLHFYGSFHTVGASRGWYRREVRAVKLGRGVHSYKDAQGFRVGPEGAARKPRVLPSGARMFHYGWVRPPEEQARKIAEMKRHYGGEDEARRHRAQVTGWHYDPSMRVRAFTGTHPGPMREWVALADWPFEPVRAGLRWGSLRRDLLDGFERLTGIRPGEYRNYELL
jgi:hypothetical protein